MKHSNFLSKTDGWSCSHGIVTSGTTVGSPSVHRRGALLKLLSVLVLVLTIGIGNVWGYTITFKTSTGSSDGTAAKTSKTDVIDSGGDYVTSSFSASYLYYGANSSGIRFGSGNYAGTMTLPLTSTGTNVGQIKASKITFKDAKYYSTDESTLGYTITYTSGSSTTTGSITLTTTATDYDVELDKTRTISQIYICASAKKKRFYITAIEITEASTTPTYTITPATNDESYGTVSLDGSVITASPKTGYRVSTTTPYSVSPANSATVAQNGNVFTVTPSANTTVTINFEPIPTYTVTLKDDNTTLPQGSAGASVTLPSREDCGNYTFAGWTKTWTSEVSTETTTAPEIIPAGSYTPTENENLYPVYIRVESGSGASPTAYSVGDVGDFVLAVNVNEKWYAIPTNPTVNNGKIAGVEIEVSTANNVNYVSSSNATGYAWNIAASGDYYTLFDGTYYLHHSSGGSSGTNLAIGITASYKWNISSDEDGLLFAGVSGTTVGSRGMLSSGTTFGGYSLTNKNTTGYYRVQVLPIAAGSTTYYISSPDCSAPTCEKKVTISKGTTANGSFTLNKAEGAYETCDAAVDVIVTPTADPNYHVGTVSATTGELGVDNNDGTWTITYEQETNATSTINVTFVEDTKYDVKWNVSGVITTTNKAYENGQPTLPADPTVLECANTFMGWSFKNFSTVPKTAADYDDLFKDASNAPAITNDTTFFAVFANGTPSTMNVLLSETFDNERTADQSQALSTIGENFTCTGSVYEGAYGTLKFGSNSNVGSITSKTLDLSEDFKVSLKAKQYSDKTSVLYVKVGDDTRTISTSDDTNPLTSEFKTFTLAFEGTEETSIEIGTATDGKRAYIDEVLVYTGEPASASGYVTKCAPVAAPVIALAADTYNEAQSTTITCTTENAVIHYTTDGSAPSDQSAVYSGEIAIDRSMTLKAIAIKDNVSSDPVSATYVLQPLTPTITKTPKHFLENATVTIACETADVAIHYTIDGNDPTASSPTYSAPFAISATTTVKAIAVKTNWDNSAIESAVFEKAETPISVAAALEVIDEGTNLDGRYVTGIISSVTSYDQSYKSLTYNISDDGLTTSDQLKIYSGKGLDGADFSALTDLSVGDVVIVYGNLLNHSTGKEMNYNNELAKLTRVIAAPTFTPDGGAFLNTMSVTIATTEEESEIRYTIDGNDPTESSALYEEPIELSATTTIKAATFKGGNSSSVIEKTFTKGTKISVTEALAALDENDPIANQFVYGIVSTAASYVTSGGKMTYKISVDGAAENELKVYNGKGMNGANFANKDELQVGDEVTVYGNLTIYEEEKEFGDGNYLLEFNRPTYSVISVSLPATATVKAGKTITLTPTFNPTNASDQAVTWSSDAESVATVDANGVVTGGTVGTAHITVTTHDGNKQATCTVTVAEAITFNNPAYEWQKVTSSAQLVAGNYYVIASESKGKVASDISSQVMGEESAVFADDAIAYNAFGTAQTADASDAVVLQLGGEEDAWTLEDVVDDHGLLGATTVKKLAWGDGTTTWSITIGAGGNATIQNGTESYGSFRHNVNDKRFTTYTSATSSTMLLPQLYVWAEKVYKLRYDANGGTNAPAATPAENGEAEVTSATPTAPTGQIFNGWNENAAGTGESYAAGDVIAISDADVTIFAQWRDPYTYHVTYDANGGTLIEEEEVIVPEDVTEGTQYTVKENVYEKEGFVFGGWEYAGEVYQKGDKFIVTEDVPFVAKWNELQVTDFVLVTNINQVQNGDKVYIVAAGNKNFAAGTLNTDKNYLYAVDIQKSADKSHIVAAEGAASPAEFTVTINGSQLNLQDADGQYFYSTSAKSVGYRTAEFAWTITIDDAGNTTLSAGDAGYLKYNSSDPRFTTYASGQSAVVLYKKLNYTREVPANQYGTICLPNGGNISGATIYEVAYFDNAVQKIFFDEVLDGKMEAGMPYIFLPDEDVTKLEVVYTDAENKAAGNYNGLWGSYEQTALPIDGQHYILYNNQYWEVNSVAYVGANRGYLKIGGEGDDFVPKKATPVQQGRRRVAMGVNGEQNATGVDEVQGDNVQGSKVLINNRLFILRGEKMYDATGRLVK